MYKKVPQPKKTVVIDMEYMRPTPEKKRSRQHKNNDNYDSNESSTDSTDSSSSTDTDVGLDSVVELDEGNVYKAEQNRIVAHMSNNNHNIKDSDYAVDSDEDLLQSVLDEPTFPLDVNAILSAMSKN